MVRLLVKALSMSGFLLSALISLLLSGIPFAGGAAIMVLERKKEKE